ncbi:MAG: c-type cytochrome biogenesis protein CcsB [Deltaproteobacteria bacterium]|nr:c-type cytochrome biogenesis protein CcsB [Deltaproteobacteria bacterium]
MMDTMFLKAALAVYFVSVLGYVTSIYVRRVMVAKVSTWIFFLAFLCHTISFIFRYLETGHTPVISIYETLSFFAWAMAGVYLAFQPKTKTRVLGAFVSPVTFLLMIAASKGLEGYVSIPEVLKSNLVPLHVILSVTGEALFALASFAGAMYLIQEGLIKNKKVSGFSRMLPSLSDLDRINHFCLMWGFPLLTLGVLVGSLWARTAWGSHWQWDPKQVWTLVAWVFYALLLHQRLAIGWKGHKAAFLSLLAFAILLVSLVAINLFFVTAHSFI